MMSPRPGIWTQTDRFTKVVVDVLAAFWARLHAMVLDVVWTTQSLAERIKPIDDVVTARATCADVIRVVDGRL